MKLKFFSIAFALAIAFAGYAQRAELPQTQVNGHTYYYYDVNPGETVFSISSKLNIPRERIIECNPAVADGLQAYTRLYFPIESGKVTASTIPAEGVKHTVQKGETLYGISRQYGITVDRLIELNPSARDGVKQGQTLIVAAPDAKPRQATSLPPKSTRHTIAQGETLYRIAAQNSITVEQLLKANPGLDALNYSAGTEITIPGADALADNSGTSTSISNTPSASPSPAPAVPSHAPVVPGPQAPSPEQYHQQQQQKLPKIETVEEKAPEGAASFDIALLLPFHLNAEKPAKAARLYTDFYRGFLLAANEFKSSGKPIKIHVYDTQASADSVAAIMRRPEMKRMHAIVGPESEASLSEVINAADEDSTFIINPFVVKNQGFTDHPNVIQLNIQQEQMLSRAADAFIKELGGRTPVFISRIHGEAEKSAFVDEFKARLKDHSIPFREISYSSTLYDTDLAALDSIGNYAFIPISGQRGEFLKFKDALKGFALRNPNGITLLGYPDWVAFRGDLVDDLEAMNAVIYTRFYYDPQYYKAQKVVADYARYYDGEPIDGAPMQAILGYDTGLWLIKALRNNGGDFHLRSTNVDGLQNSFILDDSDCEGLVNTALFLIRFKTGGITERVKL